MSDYVSSDRFLDVGDVQQVLNDPATPRTAPVELANMADGTSIPILAVMLSEGDEHGVIRVYFYTEQP